MFRRAIWGLACALAIGAGATTSPAVAQQPVPYGVPVPAYVHPWAGGSSATDWERFYHYPYVFYPQNFWGNEYYRSSDSLYYRYPPEMRIPVYNKKWFNYYPEERRYHWGHHFMLDVF